MDIHILSLLAFLVFLTHLWVAINCATYPSNICTQTPYPELCSSLTSATRPQTTLDDENLPDFRDMSLRTTLAQAENALKLVSNMDLRSFNELGKLAWADCLELYEDTIYQLNRSVESKNINAPIDAQTWLSASITNEQSCQNGFLDFNLSSHLPSMLSDFSKFLSNSLAINKAMALSSSSSSSLKTTKQTKNRRLLLSSNDNDFPEWISVGDRKLLQSSGATTKADIVVAQDGSGNYKTISEALAAATKQRSGTRRFVIYVKKGIYKENVEVKRSMRNLMFIGDGIDATIVTANKNVQDGSTTFRSATFAVSGNGFIARGMTFENTAGPGKHQGVALRSGSDFSVFYTCSFKGYQDTLYVYSQRQFYRDCDIYGTVDFIFGDAVAVIQNSNIYVRKPMPNQRNTVTAQSRKDPNQNTGIVIHGSRVSTSAASGYQNYLGRPWQRYSRTVYMKCAIDSGIAAAGWLPWSGDFGLSTLYYAEYMNTGSGASTGGRVKWPGFHVITSAAEAGKFSVGSFLAGDSWIPDTGVPFTSGL
ncbi:probable pectinesterase/pectinesterase inhibitor 6 [Phtheirospermum japonicum]|uniref:Pectinesterase n=1 Tax=Phtheirospermum japonicum TaxID=374723 RepID=A0A830D9Y0_9LAMI|nr:probable pectinesterase/pectinesterase inhibitor 6 [Phtheirospermum japonicum]